MTAADEVVTARRETHAPNGEIVTLEGGKGGRGGGEGERERERIRQTDRQTERKVTANC